MGNCMHGGGEKVKAAVVEYPSGRHEFVIGGRVTAHQVMLRNPGFYVAKTSPPPSAAAATRTTSFDAAPLNRTRPAPSLLPADAVLCTGAHYRLLSFEEVFYQFARVSTVEFMFSPKLRSCRMMQHPTNGNHQQQSKRRPLLSFNHHPSPPTPNKKGKPIVSLYKHPFHKSYF
eukprot:c10357_g1_i1 orf=388-906(-)